MRKTVLTALTISTFLTCAAGASREFSSGWKVETSPAKKMPLAWFSGDTITLNLTSTQNGSPLDLTGATLVWELRGWSDYTNLYAVATGTVVSATNGQSRFELTSEQTANLPETCLGFAKAVQTNGNSLVLGWQTIRVDWADTSGSTALDILPSPFYTKAEVDAIQSAITSDVAQVVSDLSAVSNRVTGIEAQTNLIQSAVQPTDADYTNAIALASGAATTGAVAQVVSDLTAVSNRVTGIEAQTNLIQTAVQPTDADYTNALALAGSALQEEIDPAWHGGTNAIWKSVANIETVHAIDIFTLADLEGSTLGGLPEAVGQMQYDGTNYFGSAGKPRFGSAGNIYIVSWIDSEIYGGPIWQYEFDGEPISYNTNDTFLPPTSDWVANTNYYPENTFCFSYSNIVNGTINSKLDADGGTATNLTAHGTFSGDGSGLTGIVVNTLSGGETNAAPSVAAVKAGLVVYPATWTALGNSMTSNNYGYGSYVDSAQELLPANITVYNLGVAGATTSNMYATITNSLPSIIVTNTRNVVTLEAPINDFNAGLTVDQAVAGYMQIVDYILSYGADVELYCIIWDGYYFTVNTSMREFSEAIRPYANGRFGVIDAESWLGDPLTGTTQTKYIIEAGGNQHLNQLGNDILGSLVSRSIMSRPDSGLIYQRDGDVVIAGSRILNNGLPISPAAFVSQKDLFGVFSTERGIATNDYWRGTDVGTNTAVTSVWRSDTRGEVMQFATNEVAQSISFDDADLKITSDLTVSFWYYRNSATAAANIFKLLWGGTTPVTGTDAWELRLNTRQPTLLMSSSGTGTITTNLFGGKLTNQQDYFISIAFDSSGTNATVMVDEVVYTAALSGAVTNTTQLTMGSAATARDKNDVVQIDQVRIYKRALSTNEMLRVKRLDELGYTGP